MQNNNMQDIFHNATLWRGGRYVNPQQDNLWVIQRNVVDAGNELINHIRNESYDLPRIHFDFINEMSFNACAFKFRKFYFVGINIELIIVLLRFYNYIMSHPRIFPNIGDSSREIESNIINNIQVDDYNYLQLFMNYDTEIYLPIDESRQRYVYKLFFKAVEFLLMHEYGHVVMGHVDLVNSLRGNSFMFEATYSDEIGLLNQTLEMDADCYATKIGFHRLISIFEHDSLQNSNIKFEDYLFEWYITIYFIFRLLANKEYNLDNLNGYSHPVPGIRQYIVLLTLYSLLEEEMYSKYKEYSTVLGDVFTKASKECEVALKYISDKTFTPAPISVLATDKGYNQIFKIMNNWKQVRPLLEPFSKLTLAPITEWNESDFLYSPWKNK